MELTIGDIIRMKSIKHETGNENRLCLTYGSPGRNKVFTALLLGVEPIDQPGSLDVEKTLHKFGYFTADQTVEMLRAAGVEIPEGLILKDSDGTDVIITKSMLSLSSATV